MLYGNPCTQLSLIEYKTSNFKSRGFSNYATFLEGVRGEGLGVRREGNKTTKMRFLDSLGMTKEGREEYTFFLRARF